ncbi:YtfJ family protein [Halieaceae bacterium IMCC14734]|uniref:YtfJ family protein n=1 Tax=Candidatus Litorirhabdus singularis TaxID=2518993 RepID=A0ABT3TGR8_9GAMM|nr:YtfJ family protein [Candidatus Litorirhabdus singularis]MCX2981520.1 YtfJ family protein [Candidatus Litorirhabdus singularis]
MKTITLIGLLWMTAASSFAGGILVGQPLPQLKISERGELLLDDDDVSYSAWQSPQQPGKAHVLQYMAGTAGASKLNEPFTERLKVSADLDIMVTTVINLDDATWGTSGFVVSEVKKNKRLFPMSQLVLDDDGHGREVWSLPRKSSAIVITDAAGIVLYVKEGAMDESEIERALELLRGTGSPAVLGTDTAASS